MKQLILKVQPSDDVLVALYEFRPYKFEWQALDVFKFENRNLDVIREALHNVLGYAVTAKYKAYTHELVEVFQK